MQKTPSGHKWTQIVGIIHHKVFHPYQNLVKRFTLEQEKKLHPLSFQNIRLRWFICAENNQFITKTIFNILFFHGSKQFVIVFHIFSFIITVKELQVITLYISKQNKILRSAINMKYVYHSQYKLVHKRIFW